MELVGTVGVKERINLRRYKKKFYLSEEKGGAYTPK
jgi:hypothetical protein